MTTITFVGSQQFSASRQGSPGPIQTSGAFGAIQTGDLLLAIPGVFNGAPTEDIVTDTTSPGTTIQNWTRLSCNNDNALNTVALFWKLAEAGDNTKHVGFLPSEATAYAISVVAYRGVNGSSPIADWTHNAGATALSVNVPSGGALAGLFSADGNNINGGSSIDPPAGMTERSDIFWNSFVGTEVCDILSPGAGASGNKTCVAQGPSAGSEASAYLVAIAPVVDPEILALYGLSDIEHEGPQETPYGSELAVLDPTASLRPDLPGRAHVGLP